MKKPFRARSALWMTLIALSLAAPSAHAGVMEEAVPAIRAFGLLGTWAPDCSKPISAENPRSRYYIATQPETVVHTFANSEAGVNASNIAAYSEIVAVDRLAVVLRKTNTATVMAVIQRVGDGIQISDALDSNGKQLVMNGILTAVNRPSQVFHRCQD